MLVGAIGAAIIGAAVLGVYSTYTGTIIVHQGFGAILVLVLFGLWTGRRHLRDVFSKAFRGDPRVDDSGEIHW